MNDFFGFNKMITESIVKVLYVFGMLLITVVSIYFIVNDNFIELGGFIWWLTLILGNIVWRIICEGIIVAFSIYTNISNINKNLNSIIGSKSEIDNHTISNNPAIKEIEIDKNEI
jgi:hypothetical protein